MQKQALLKDLQAKLEARLASSRSASLEAADYATNEEARAESKWDTQGLEASYLAAGQAQQARELQTALSQLASLQAALNEPCAVVKIGALVEVAFGEEIDWYLIAPVGGGEELESEGEQVTVLTPQGPLFALLQGQGGGFRGQLGGGAAVTIRSIS